MYGVEKKYAQNFEKEAKGKRKTFNALVYWDVNMKIDFKKIRWQNVDWINLAQDGGKWWDIVVAVMNSVLYKLRRISGLAEELLAS